MISDFRLQIDEICILGHYAAYDGESLPTLRDKMSALPSRAKNNFLAFEDRTHKLSLKIVDKELPPFNA
jgi:hypothetical protein